MCGGGGRFSRPGDDLGWVKPDNASYESDANAYLKDRLGDYNVRNTEAVHRHLGALERAIASDIEGSVDMLFGGSVKRHTAVDGLSDVDVLLVVNRSSLADGTPREILQYLEQRIRERLPNTDVKVGALAVTVTYSDGVELQLLPALRTSTGIRIAAGEDWSRVVRPKTFAEKLTSVNQECGGRVVPVIKLFKGLQDSLPKDQKISGYHAESLAIEAFNDYSGRRTLKDMLTHLVNVAKTRVLTPIADSTGQSVHVDDKLGEPHSAPRQTVAAALTRLSAKLAEADRSGDTDQIKDLFER